MPTPHEQIGSNGFDKLHPLQQTLFYLPIEVRSELQKAGFREIFLSENYIFQTRTKGAVEHVEVLRKRTISLVDVVAYVIKEALRDNPLFQQCLRNFGINDIEVNADGNIKELTIEDHSDLLSYFRPKMKMVFAEPELITAFDAAAIIVLTSKEAMGKINNQYVVNYLLPDEKDESVRRFSMGKNAGRNSPECNVAFRGGYPVGTRVDTLITADGLKGAVQELTFTVPKQGIKF